jgi:hypothetical protein
MKPQRIPQIAGVLIAVTLVPFARADIWSRARDAIIKQTVPKPLADAAFKQALPAVKTPPRNPVEAKQSKPQILAELSSYESLLRAYSVESDGRLTYLTAGVSGRSKTVLIQQDFVNYKKAIIDGRETRVGVVLRIEAELVTKDRDINLNGLFAIGVALRQGSIAGQLRVQVHGVTGEPIMALIPMPSEVSETSIQHAMQAIATIKALLYDEKVSIIPQEIST